MDGCECLVDLGVIVFEGGMEPAAEAICKGMIVDEEVFLGGTVQGFVFGMKCGGGDDVMNVRVVLDLTAPGVQHAGEAKARAAGLGGGDVLKGGGALTQEERIENFGMKQAKGAQFLRQREGDHEVGHGQETGFLFGGPDLGVERAALRTGAVVAAVVGVVLLMAAVALIEPSAHRERAARDDAPHGPVMVVGELVPMGMGVIFPMLTEQVCELQGHGTAGLQQVALTIREGGEGVAAFGFANLGEMKIADDFLERAVAEIGGDLPDRRAAFQHVRGVAVAQGVGAEMLVGARQPAFGGGDLDGLPDGGLGHGLGTAVHGLAQRDAGAFPAAADAGKEPFGVLVAGVELAQAGEKSGSDGDFARLAVLGFGDVNDEPFAVDVLGFDGERFVEPQSALIDDGAVGAVAAVTKGAQETSDLVAGEHVGKRFVALDVDLFPDVPVEAEVVAVEGAQRADGLVECARPELALVLKVDEEVEHALRRQVGQVLVRVMSGELADPAVVGQA